MELQKAIDLIEKSQHLAILMPQDASLDYWAAAEVLLRVLENHQKQVGLLNPEIKNSLRRPEIFKKIAAANPLPKEFIVSLDTVASPISQLRYEKQDSRVDIIFSPQSFSISKDAVSFRDGKIQCDAVILLGIEDIEKVSESLNLEPEFFTETPLINISTSANAKPVGEVNLIDSHKSSISEIIYSLISALEESPLEQESATLLLAGVLQSTNGFRPGTTTADTLLASSELMRLGADYTQAFGLVSESTPLNLAQLSGRASVRSKTDDEGRVLWSFLTAEDFEKTGRTPADLPQILDYLENNFPSHEVVALLWQDPAERTIQTMLAGDRTVLENLNNEGGGEFQSPYLNLKTSFASFKEGEEQITSLLEKVL